MVGRWTRGLVVASVEVVAVALIIACSKERGLEPKPQKSRVYVMMQARKPVVYVFDADADSLVDSLDLPFTWPVARVICDPDNPRVALARGRDVMLYMAGTSIPYLSATLGSLFDGFDSDRGVVVSSDGTVGGIDPPQFHVYSLPDLSLIYQDTFGLASEAFELDRKRGLAFGAEIYESTPGGPDFRVELCAYDYVNRKFHRRWNILPDANGKGYLIRSFALHPDGRRVFISADAPDGPRFLAYDLIGDSAIFNVSVPYIGNAVLAPDHYSIWYAVPGNGLHNDPETITIYNATTGSIQSVITLTEYRGYPHIALAPGGIVFTPSGEKAYVTCAGRAGPVLVIDVASLKVTKAFYFKRGENPEPEPRHMDIGPAPDF